MPLNDYRKKRNFKKTSEPSGMKVHSNGVLHFVVQKHNASHLHYDFRLENHGVLKSWAVPKGISDDPSVKRLAIEVEDHPLEYQHFEGTIPKGNYGAGTVEIWDRGEYYIDKDLNRQANDRKVEEDLHKGHLSFYLRGKKLHGRYALVKMHGTTGKKNQWLLMKKDPETPSAMPQSIKPMLATLAAEPFNRKDWIFEVKWDGYRMIAHIKNHQVNIYSRNDKAYTEKFPTVVEDLKGLPDCILDGEIVVVDDKGVSRFQLLQNYLRHQQGRLLYYVFDILFLEGKDLHQLPLSRRKEILKKLAFKSDTVRLSDFVLEKGKHFYKAAKDNGLEGIVAKKLESTYQYGHRGLDWLKIKAIQEQEAIICGFTAPKGSRKFFGALILGIYKDKELHYVGHTGGGFDDELLKDIHQRLKPLITNKCPFRVKPKTNAPVTWIKPKLLCAAKFQEWTDGGQMRQPIFLGLREDKQATEVHQEIPQALPKVLPKRAVSIPKTKATLTNLEKIYWPQEGITKGDMIRYYQDIAPYILPYLKGRPQSLHRQPNGIQDQGFFQKDINFEPPSWIKTLSLKSESKHEVVHHLICEDKNSLAYMNNLGCIEINPWCSTAQAPMYPDFLVLDFDPVEVDFPKVIDAVLMSRELLIKAYCDGFCKTSGSRGIHVYVPLKRKYTFDQTKDFAQILCTAIHKKIPKATSLERSPEKRKGLIYLDYLQNHFTSTMAAPYSLRPRPGAPVSTPLEWKEVKRTLIPEDFNIHTIIPRLKKKGDLWKGVLGRGMDMQKSLKALERL